MPTLLATLGPTINASGITIPDYADILYTLKEKYRSIYGSDVYLEDDSQDGQWIAIIAAAQNDSNASVVAAYNSRSPSTAVGEGLSSVVKINGIKRQSASNSTADVVIGGQDGTTITNGIVADALQQRWSLPASVLIPDAGEITVTATAIEVGALQAPAATITKILTPTLGWQTVTNTLAATPGAAVETDAQLRARQRRSTALPSVTPLDGLYGLVADLDGVTQVQIYENDTDATDGNGLPEHSIAAVVEGGDAQEIANAIFAKKTMGAFTYGTTTESVIDAYGVPRQIRFSRPITKPIDVVIEIDSQTGYTSVIGTKIRQAVTEYINALEIGSDVILTRLYVPANLNGDVDEGAETFELLSIMICLSGGSPAAADIAIGFNEVATCDIDDVTLTVVP